MVSESDGSSEILESLCFSAPHELSKVCVGDDQPGLCPPSSPQLPHEYAYHGLLPIRMECAPASEILLDTCSGPVVLS